jgi:hypothetical protein
VCSSDLEGERVTLKFWVWGGLFHKDLHPI